ncbi:hypothetical protein BGZ95_008257 [Linnemannia exigua]|uniref:Uncharacterized protein n=1 Tax=Linnemannia exigua TaxID=604196 RepID=A0AAD4DE97_9FUNG|nr:hypothetical protein BGZ95_008257 [Linnemannia exigua]
MAAVSSRLDGLSEVTELERIPLPYKELYHTLVVKNDMPVDLLQEKHRTGAQQLLTWIQAALDLVKSVNAASQQEQQQQQQQQREENVYNNNNYDGRSNSRTSSSTSLLEGDLDVEIQDVVSGFGQYEPTIESSIEILLQLEECIPRRLSSSSTAGVTGDSSDNDNHDVHLSKELESILEQWSLLRGIISDLGGSVREQQRLRDGIQSIFNISEQTREATDILDKCYNDIAAEKARISEWASSPLDSIERVVSSLKNHSSSSLNGAGGGVLQSWGVDRNDMLELDSRIGLLSLKMESLHKSYPECARSSKQSRRGSGSNKSEATVAVVRSLGESESIAEKKAMMQRQYQELLGDWYSLRTRRDQLWRGLEECDRWRTKIDKMAKQIETMLEPVEIFQRMCVNLLANLEGQTLAQISGEEGHHQQQQPQNNGGNGDEDANKASTSKQPSLPVDLELLTATLQELDEKQLTVTPAIENIFWVQEGEIHHRSKNGNNNHNHNSTNNGMMSPMTPTTAVSMTGPPLSAIDSPTTTLVTPPSPPSNHNNNNGNDSSPLYPSLEMLDRQRELKQRWSNLKISLNTVGTKLQTHHTILKEKQKEEEELLARLKRQQQQEQEAEEARIAEEKRLASDGYSIDRSDWRSSRDPSSPSALRRSATGTSSSSRSPSVARSVTRPISPNWNTSNRFLRGKLVSSLSMDSGVVRKYMLVKSDQPEWAKPRPWCPSVSTTSPSMPGFPLQSSYWGYFLVGNDPSKENFGQIIASPAPPLVRSDTPSPPKPTTPSLKDTRPPFSPGGNRKFTALSTPPRPMPNRSMSVASGEFKQSLSPAGGTDILDWTKTLRRSTSFSTNAKPNKGNTPPTPRGNNKIKGSGSTTSSNNTARPGGAGQGRESVASTRRNSNASQISQWNNGKDHQYRQDTASSSSARRPSFTSSEDDESTIMGYTAGANGQAPLPNNANRRARRLQGHTKSGGLGYGVPPPPLNTMTDSTSSLDSMMSSTSSFNAYGSSLSSSIGMRSPSPYAPMFGSSFAAARSTAALHTALLASMSSSSSASLRYSNSSLGGSGASGGAASALGRKQSDAGSSSSASSLMSKKRSQMMNLGAGAGSASSASSWMSMNTGGLLSALSFTVPTYNNFDDDFSGLGNLEESIAAM